MTQITNIVNTEVSPIVTQYFPPAKYVGVLPHNDIVRKGSLGKLVKGTEDYEFIPILKSFKVYENISSGTALKVYPKHNMGVSDTFYDASGQNTITAIDTDTSELYHIFTVTSMSATAGDVLVQEETPETDYAAMGNIVMVAEDKYFGKDTATFVDTITNVAVNRYNLPFYLGELSAPIQLSTIQILPYNLLTVPAVADKTYKEYVGVATQTTTGAPVVTVLKNDLSAAIVYTRTGTGEYLGTLADAFTPSKTVLEISNNFLDAQAGIAWVDKNSFTISTWEHDGTVTDGLLVATAIKIRVYN